MKIVYYTAGEYRMASSRLRAFMPGKALADMGHIVLWNPIDPGDDCDVVIVQKRGDMIPAMDAFRRRGMFVVWDCDDWYPQLAYARHHVDMVTVDTEAKQKLFPGAVVVPDALDVKPDSPIKAEHADALKTVVWFGHPENVPHIEHMTHAASQLGLDVVVVTETKKAPRAFYENVHWFEWQPFSVDDEIVQADLVALPLIVHDDAVAAKSRNKLLKAWALGMPVAATPINDYVAAGLEWAASTVEEWVQVLTALQDRTLREADAERGRARALEHMAGNVALQWLSVLEAGRAQKAHRAAHARRLMVGSGRHRVPGYVTLDADPNALAEITASVPPLPETVKAEAWDEIAAYHFLEHLYLWEARAFLRECYEALKPGGLLALEMPDLEKCCQALLGLRKAPGHAAPGQFDMWGLFGDPNHENKLYGHHWGYTPATLAEELQRAGFRASNITEHVATTHEPGRDFRMEAVK